MPNSLSGNIPDRHEVISMMEPIRLGEDSRHRAALLDLAFELVERSTGFRRSLPESILSPLADLVRAMNCYYSNLIEGHNTHPIDIERALLGNLSPDKRKRDLQLEAKAHIEVQKWIDEGGLAGRSTTVEAIREIHRRFFLLLPDELLWAEDPDTGERVHIEPGEFRTREVQVGDLIAISPGAVPRFLERFEHVYAKLGKAETILNAAAAHHRLAWIHPFLDGNGRVVRLVSHATLLDSLSTGAVWSIARGLARNVDEYKRLLANCDRTRRNDLDGRGNLSEEALAAFTRFFLSTCLDQVNFMESLMQPNTLRTRIMLWTQEQIALDLLPAKADRVLSAVLTRGELPRAEVMSEVDTGERQAQRIVKALSDQGVLSSKSPKAPLRLAFPATLAHRWLPNLFPEKLD